MYMFKEVFPQPVLELVTPEELWSRKSYTSNRISIESETYYIQPLSRSAFNKYDVCWSCREFIQKSMQMRFTNETKKNRANRFQTS